MDTTKKLFSLLAAFCLTLAIVGCGGGGDDEASPDPPSDDEMEKMSGDYGGGAGNRYGPGDEKKTK